LFCQHPVTTEFDRAVEQTRPSIDALISLAQQGYQIVITYPNNDAGGRRIIQQLQELEARKLNGIWITKSLGRYRFHGMLNLIGRVGRGAFVGNSSAGIKETPVFGCPVVNVGSRQQGRLRADNVLDVPYDASEIAAAIQRCIEDEDFRHQCQNCQNPYGTGNAGPRIADVLATISIDARLLQKKMTY
jgi:UDP-N-acetylglucosamine 2-epimerase (non-hydrolysing)/GDP/UDP-N,N'-diacetylbacillosamine 2-epimerase (hydrolysing)